MFSRARIQFPKFPDAKHTFSFKRPNTPLHLPILKQPQLTTISDSCRFIFLGFRWDRNSYECSHGWLLSAGAGGSQFVTFPHSSLGSGIKRIQQQVMEELIHSPDRSNDS